MNNIDDIKSEMETLKRLREEARDNVSDLTCTIKELKIIFKKSLKYIDDNLLYDCIKAIRASRDFYSDEKFDCTERILRLEEELVRLENPKQID